MYGVFALVYFWSGYMSSLSTHLEESLVDGWEDRLP
jgi:hypothetical protein